MYTIKGLLFGRQTLKYKFDNIFFLICIDKVLREGDGSEMWLRVSGCKQGES